MGCLLRKAHLEMQLLKTSSSELWIVFLRNMRTFNGHTDIIIFCQKNVWISIFSKCSSQHYGSLSRYLLLSDLLDVCRNPKRLALPFAEKKRGGKTFIRECLHLFGPLNRTPSSSLLCPFVFLFFFGQVPECRKLRNQVRQRT